MRRICALVLLSSSLTANVCCPSGCNQPVGMNGAPWPTRPKATKADEKPQHKKELEEGDVVEFYGEESRMSDIPLLQRVWKPGVLSIGLALAAAGGIVWIKQKDCCPEPLLAEAPKLSRFAHVHLFSEEPTQLEIRHDHSLLWQGEISGNAVIPISIPSQEDAHIEVQSINPIQGELHIDGEMVPMDLNHSFHVVARIGARIEL